MLSIIKRRKLTYCWHIKRPDTMQKRILEGRVERIGGGTTKNDMDSQHKRNNRNDVVEVW